MHIVASLKPWELYLSMLSGIRASLAVPLLDLQQKLYLQQQQIGCEGSGFHLARPWMLKETVTKKNTCQTQRKERNLKIPSKSLWLDLPFSHLQGS